jgi:medium-chain acyl-[acyl-carrier-protein] hydrolase
MVEGLARAIMPYLDLPFAFFGHSMGALISFELARRLRSERNLLPLQLSVSGCPAPNLPRKREPIHDLPEAEFIQELRRLNGTPSELLDDPELMQFIVPVIRADFELCETYQYSGEPPLACPISAFGGLEDDQAGQDELEAWREQTTSLFRIHLFPGDHFYLHEFQPLLVEALSSELDKMLALRAG